MKSFLFALALAVTAAAAEPPATPGAKPQDLSGLHNFFQIEAGVFSGSSPMSDESFAALAKLGVKTIISVDGGKPPVDLARRHGIRYVHIPIGYDGVSAEKSTQLVKAASTAAGPVYIHCHHGKHRGPAAAAVVCQAIKGWSPEKATDWLEKAGTSHDYAGLYRDVKAFQKPTSEALAKLPAQLPEIAPTPDIVDTMVTMDDLHDALKAAQAAGWKAEPRSPAELATLLLEEHKELQRSPDTAKRDPDYRERLQAATANAEALQAALKSPAISSEERTKALKTLSQDCAACHKAHRD